MDIYIYILMRTNRHDANHTVNCNGIFKVFDINVFVNENQRP